ncbi:solute carrier family 22 member 3-like [Hydractinia symbiolongicarpus]|uniref:solute carrier family 22 member 3-like n=1 Tax=Hydractinia symbiolongicarpus TaxID=13093 RepID=UPI00254A3323|nr:solute carrier family 22 member 3-like [Hydractinia symbiolongicarpus]
MEEEKELVASKNTEVTVDQMLTHVGEFKRYQWLLDAIYCIMLIPATYQVLIMYFAALNPPWRCIKNGTVCTSNQTFDGDDKTRCNLPRSEWEYTEAKEYSIVTQFDINCDNEWQVHLTTSILFIGWGIGAVVLGWVADNYGRKIVLFPCMVMVILIGFVTSFVPNITLFILCRFAVGFFTPGTSVQMFILISEVVGSRFRPLAGIILWVFFTLGLCILGLKAYFIREWKILFIVCTVPYVFVLLFFKFIPESVRWLRLHGKVDEAMNILENIAKWNKREIPSGVRICSAPKSVEAHKSSPLDLFKTRRMAIKTLTQGYGWMVNGMVYYGLSLAADDLGGSLYRNYVLFSAIEFPAMVMAIDFCERFGRKKTVIMPMVVGGIACILVAFVPDTGDAKYVRVVIGLLGKMCITLSFDAIYTWSVEIYPTAVRAEGMGFLQVTSRIGAASAPWVAKGLRSLHKSVPFAFMGIATLLAVAGLLVLPETRGVVTSETTEEEQDLQLQDVNESL